ncbi:hypothetical protein [Micromonospora echinofusca]
MHDDGNLPTPPAIADGRERCKEFIANVVTNLHKKFAHELIRYRHFL